MSVGGKMIRERQAAIAELCRRFGVKSLQLFGSAGTDRFDSEQSDFDFLVDFLPGQDLGPWLSRYFELKDELEVLLQRPVDLVFLSAVKNHRFRLENERARELVYAA